MIPDPLDGLRMHDSLMDVRFPRSQKSDIEELCRNSISGDIGQAFDLLWNMTGGLDPIFTDPEWINRGVAAGSPTMIIQKYLTSGKTDIALLRRATTARSLFYQGRHHWSAGNSGLALDCWAMSTYTPATFFMIHARMVTMPDQRELCVQEYDSALPSLYDRNSPVEQECLRLILKDLYDYCLVQKILYNKVKTRLDPSDPENEFVLVLPLNDSLLGWDEAQRVASRERFRDSNAGRMCRFLALMNGGLSFEWQSYKDAYETLVVPCADSGYLPAMWFCGVLTVAPTSPAERERAWKFLRRSALSGHRRAGFLLGFLAAKFYRSAIFRDCQDQVLIIRSTYALGGGNHMECLVARPPRKVNLARTAGLWLRVSYERPSIHHMQFAVQYYYARFLRHCVKDPACIPMMMDMDNNDCEVIDAVIELTPDNTENIDRAKTVALSQPHSSNSVWRLARFLAETRDDFSLAQRCASNGVVDLQRLVVQKLWRHDKLSALRDAKRWRLDSAALFGEDYLDEARAAIGEIQDADALYAEAQSTTKRISELHSNLRRIKRQQDQIAVFNQIVSPSKRLKGLDNIPDATDTDYALACCICHSEPVSVCFRTCGHVIGAGCLDSLFARALDKEKDTFQCPFCRRDVRVEGDDVIRMHMY